MISPEPTPPPDRVPVLSRALAGGGLLSLIGSALCLGFRYAEMHRTLGRPAGNIFYFLLVHFETWQFAITGLAMIALSVLVNRPDVLGKISAKVRWTLAPERTALVLSLIALVICAVGTFTAYHGYPLCIDEYLPTLQAKLFARGQVFAHIPEEWRYFAPSMTTIFLMFDPHGFRWTQVFLPVYAAIRAGLSFVGLDAITGALLAALSVWATWACGRRLWPDKPHLRLVATALVLANTQVLIMGMTAYAWPAHLALNLVFLALYLDERRGIWIAPFIGFLAFGLHQPHVHPLFAIPLVARFVWQRRWKLVGYYGAIYLAGAVCWYQWLKMVRLDLPRGDLEGTFGFPNSEMLWLQWCNAALLLAWSTPLMWALAGVAWARWRTLPALARDLTAGIALSFVFYFAFPHSQGHGWGYRFLHGLLGSAALLAAYGWEWLEERGFQPVLRGALTLSLVFSALWQLPSRLWEVDEVVAPFAHASEVIEHAPADFVLIDAGSAWYAGDLVRNDPFLRNRPKIMFARGFNEALFNELKKRGRIMFLSGPQLYKLGLRPGVIPQPDAPPAGAEAPAPSAEKPTPSSRQP